MKEIHSEIEYRTGEGNIHSDIVHGEFKKLTPEHRKRLHNCLDEWLDCSEGTGIFYIGDDYYADRDL